MSKIKLKRNLRYNNLKPFDIVFTTAQSPFAWLERIALGKKFNDSNVPVHVGCITESWGQYLMCEMLIREGLTESSLEKYCAKKNNKILDIIRIDIMKYDVKIYKIMEHIAKRRRKLKDSRYETSLLFKFLKPFKKIKNDPDRLICSEFIYELLKIGTSIELPRAWADCPPSPVALYEFLKGLEGIYRIEAYI